MIKHSFLTLFIMILKPLLSQQAIDEILRDYKNDKTLKHASYSFCIMDASSGEIIKEHNSDIALIPASTLKIVTTSAALGILGKNYTYKTSFYLKKNQQNTTDLIIKGSGDPSFGSAYFYNNDTAIFLPLIKKLDTNQNLKITGNLYADISHFDNLIPSSWIWADISNYYGTNASGLSYRDNKFSFWYNSGLLNTEATLQKITPDYFSDKIRVESQVKSSGTEDNAFVFGDPNSYSRTITGTIPPNKINYEVEGQMPEPYMFCLYNLKKILKNHSITTPNNTMPIIANIEYQNKDLVHTHISPTLDKMVFYTNIKSNNHYAESLLKTLGAVKTKNQGTTENGIAAITQYLRDRGIDISGLHMVDGSGLSRSNTITTKFQATLLCKVYRDSLIYQSFNKSLPVAGKNGSMINLCKGTFAENNMRAKTGYIDRVRGYCGYVKTKKGKELAFSILFNNYDCSAKEMKLKIEKLLVSLVNL